MKALKLDGSKEDARRLARCLIGSKTLHGRILIGCVDDAVNNFVIISMRGMSPEDFYTATLPLDTLVLDPFAAMREGISVIADGEPTVLDQCKFGIFGKYISARFGETTWHSYKSITLDIEAACRLDGVEEVEI